MLHSVMWVCLCIPGHIHRSCSTAMAVMHTTIQACFLCFVYNPYMSFVKFKEFFHLLVKLHEQLNNIQFGSLTFLPTTEEEEMKYLSTTNAHECLLIGASHISQSLLYMSGEPLLPTFTCQVSHFSQHLQSCQAHGKLEWAVIR